MLQFVPIRDILLDDEYKVSRRPGDKLFKSVKQNGILVPPYLLRSKNGFRVMSGHNRITVAQSSGITSVNAWVLPAFGLDEFVRELLYKDYHDLLGPAGKLKGIKLAAEHGASRDAVISIGEKMAVHEYYRNDAAKINAFLAFPEAIVNVVDNRSVPFKTVRLLHEFDSSVMDRLSQIAGKVSFKMNYFKEMIELTYDLVRMKGGIEFLETAFSIAQRENVRDEDIISYLYSVRYPAYLEQKEKSEKVKKTLLQQGIELEFPPYFEGADAFVKMKISRRDKGTSFKNGVLNLEKLNVEEILKFL